MMETVVAPTWHTKARLPSWVIATPLAPSAVSRSATTDFDSRSTNSTLLGPVGTFEMLTSVVAPGTVKKPADSVAMAVLPSGVSFTEYGPWAYLERSTSPSRTLDPASACVTSASKSTSDSV